jgi:drug/metabolite transporter (DMT)-like permease
VKWPFYCLALPFIYLCLLFFAMQRISMHHKIWQWATLLFLSFIWGTSFILMKKGLVAFNNYQVAALRVFFSFVLLLPLSLRYLKRITRSTLKPLLIVGCLGIAIPALLFTTAQTYIDSSLAGMLNSMTPFFTLLVGLIFYHTKARILSISGVILGLIGAAGLIVNDFANFIDSINWYASIILLATLCYGINVNEIKAKLSHLNGIEITSLALLFIGPVAGIYLLFSDYSMVYQNSEKWSSLFYIFLLAAFCSVLALIIFNNLIRYTSAVFAASVTYIIPVFAIIWGEFDGENIGLRQLSWIVLILVGVYLVNR